MLHLSFFSWLVWLTIIAAQLALFFMLAKGEGRRRWMFLFWFVGINSLESLILLADAVLPIRPPLAERIYFHTFWAGAIVSYLIEIFMIAEIASDIAYISARISRLIRNGVIGLSVGCFLVFLFAHLLSHASNPFVASLSLLDQAISVGWLASFLAVTCGADLLGLCWPRQAIGVATGFLIESCGSSACTALLDGNLAAFAGVIKGIIYLIALVVWAISIQFREEQLEDPPDFPSLQFAIGIYKTIFKRLLQ